MEAVDSAGGLTNGFVVHACIYRPPQVRQLLPSMSLSKTMRTKGLLKARLDARRSFTRFELRIERENEPSTPIMCVDRRKCTEK